MADIRIQRSEGRVDDAFTLWLGYDSIRVTLKASYLVREPGPRYQLHGTAGSYLKYGIDPQEERLKQGDLPAGEDWGHEPEDEWGILNAEFNGRHHNGKYETLPGDYRKFYANIYRAIKEGADLLVAASDANLVVKVIEAARESNRTGRRVPVSG
jgi:predicted dehydrogenase